MTFVDDFNTRKIHGIIPVYQTDSDFFCIMYVTLAYPDITRTSQYHHYHLASYHQLFMYFRLLTSTEEPIRIRSRSYSAQCCTKVLIVKIMDYSEIVVEVF